MCPLPTYNGTCCSKPLQLLVNGFHFQNWCMRKFSSKFTMKMLVGLLFVKCIIKKHAQLHCNPFSACRHLANIGDLWAQRTVICDVVMGRQVAWLLYAKRPIRNLASMVARKCNVPIHCYIHFKTCLFHSICTLKSEVNVYFLFMCGILEEVTVT